MEPTDPKISKAARLLREASYRERQKPPQGRTKVICICPTCALEEGVVNMNAHLYHCPKNSVFDPEVKADIVLITLEEFRQELRTRLYACPVGCGQHLAYREMGRHIPKCSRKDLIFPYTVERWRKELIKSQSQPGTESVRKNRRSIAAATKKNERKEKPSAPSSKPVPATV